MNNGSTASGNGGESNSINSNDNNNNSNNSNKGNSGINNNVVAKSSFTTKQSSIEVPEFTAPIGNVTTPIGREAVLSCTVDHIAKYKVINITLPTRLCHVCLNFILRIQVFSCKPRDVLSYISFHSFLKAHTLDFRPPEIIYFKNRL